MPLVDPLPHDQLPEEVEDLSVFFSNPADGTLGVIPNSVRTMARRPDIATAFTQLNIAVMANHGALTSELKRLIGYVVSNVAGCRYCQAHTALAADRFGSSPERIRDIWSYRESSHFTEAEKAAFDFAVAAASLPNAVDENVAKALKDHWDDGDIVEILGVISLFGYLNRWNDSMASTLESEAIESATHHLAHTGWERGKHT